MIRGPEWVRVLKKGVMFVKWVKMYEDSSLKPCFLAVIVSPDYRTSCVVSVLRKEVMKQLCLRDKF